MNKTETEYYLNKNFFYKNSHSIVKVIGELVRYPDRSYRLEVEVVYTDGMVASAGTQGKILLKDLGRPLIKEIIYFL
mgnify:FL=1|jgi:hypothetical protein